MNDDQLAFPRLDAAQHPIPPGEWQRVRARARHRQHRRTAALAGALVLTAAVPVGVALAARDADPDVVDAAGPVGISGVRSVSAESLSRDHVVGPVDYPQLPPLGGDHAPVPQACGVYDAPIVTENAVHSMEHGAVWITYRPGLDADGVAALRRVVASAAPYGLLSPLPEQDSAVAATAWGSQLLVDAPDDPRLAAFAEQYANGPQTPERGAACAGTDALRAP